MSFPKEIQQEILKRDKRCRGNTVIGRRCVCDSKDAHHIIPSRDGGTDDSKNGVGLCKRHHAIADNNYTKYGLTNICYIWMKENEENKN